MADTDEIINIVYKNWRHETAKRKIRPKKIWFGSTKWHPDKQWFLRAVDIEKNAERDFALRDIKFKEKDIDI